MGELRLKPSHPAFSSLKSRSQMETIGSGESGDDTGLERSGSEMACRRDIR